MSRSTIFTILSYILIVMSLLSLGTANLGYLITLVAVFASSGTLAIMIEDLAKK